MDEQKDLEATRHSTAHLLAAAVLKLWPKVKLAIGPAIKDGFYYDFDFAGYKSAPGQEDLAKIEKKMVELAKRGDKFEYFELSPKEAKEKVKGQPYKVELVDQFVAEEAKKLSFYKSGKFTDLCAGPHVSSTDKIGYFKLTEIAGAYWRGISTNPMLTRIYGTAWPTQKELEDYLAKAEEAKRRDHKKLGPELGLFTFHPTAPGMPYWYPKGVILMQALKNFVRELNKKYGYQEISTPLLAKKEVWETSGHWELFRENMFVFDIENQTYALKPMNCPQTLVLYNTRSHSYRDLPQKLSDLDVLHRYEESGVLNGLFRVREFSQDDAHIICTQEQIEEVAGELLDMAGEVYSVFGFEPSYFLSTRPDKALGEAKAWEKAEKDLKGALREKKVKYELKPKEGAFYGPKIDLQIKDVLGRDWQLATIQLDFQMPQRFRATYVARDGTKKTLVMFHRAFLGSLERFIGILIEHFAGAFPVWLAPVQVVVLPITERNLKYAKSVVAKLAQDPIRVELDDRPQTLEAKIRDAQLAKIPYMLIVGDKEEKAKTVAERERSGKDYGQIPLDEFIVNIKKEIESKSLD